MTINSQRRIGSRYRLIEPLGRGGMGTVWAAVDEVLDREVAVKEVIPPDGLSSEDQESLRSRTMREARAAARISSRSAVTVFDVVEEDGKPWIVMERLRANTLADLLREHGPLPADRVARIGLRLLEALRAAHAAGVLHRDVKPSNVMITADGEAVLTDFGIASLEGDPSLTVTGMLIGSPAYMAPERARGGPATPAGDLWSLGCTLYTAVEGRGPFAKEGPLATLTAVITDEPYPPVRSGALAPALMALLTKDPADRPDAVATAAMLAQAERAGPSTAAHPTGVPPARARGPSEETERTRPFRAALPPSISPPPDPELRASTDPPAGEATTTGQRPSAPRHRRTEPAPARSGPSRSRAFTALVSLAVLVLAGVAGAVLLNERGPAVGAGSASGATPTVSAPTPTPPTDQPASPPTATAPPAPAESVPAGTAPARPAPAQPGAVPAGYELYQDSTGFAVAVPAGWQVTTERGSTFVREPGGRRYLQIDQTRKPKDDPAADWAAQENGVSRRLAGYERIRIDPLTYRGWKAADWEFTWQADGGPRRVLNRGLITAADRAYALYWSVPAEQWEASLAEYDVFAATFRPAS